MVARGDSVVSGIDTRVATQFQDAKISFLKVEI